jgi:hypothetical protein
MYGRPKDAYIKNMIFKNKVYHFNTLYLFIYVVLFARKRGSRNRSSPYVYVTRDVTDKETAQF